MAVSTLPDKNYSFILARFCGRALILVGVSDEVILVNIKNEPVLMKIIVGKEMLLKNRK